MYGPMNQTGGIWTKTVQGSTFSIPARSGWQGKRYVLEDRGGSVFSLGDLSADPVQVYGEEEVEVRRQGEEDMQIAKNRREKAEELSKGDRALRWVLLNAMSYANGEATPTKFDWTTKVDPSIEFYQLGRNASHSFYAGVKDGQRWYLSQDDDPQDREDIFVKRVGSFDEIGYWGHH